ncbi:PIN domain-containing protein, partial [Patescibacteria group bacterium]
MKKLVLVDANSLIHRAFYALPPFKTQDGELVNAVYGFYSILLNILARIKPDYLTVSFDVSKKTFRHEQYKEYKAKRTKAPDELYAQFDRIREIL